MDQTNKTEKNELKIEQKLESNEEARRSELHKGKDVALRSWHDMRIRKRTPTRAASPTRITARPPPQERAAEERQEGLIFALKESTMEVTRLERDDPGEVAKVKHQTEVAGGAMRCSRNDGKGWRCKNLPAPGSTFCDRHVAWWNRRQKVKKQHGRREGKKSTKRKLARPEEAMEQDEASEMTGGNDVEDGFYYCSGIRRGRQKSAKRGEREDMDGQNVTASSAEE